MTKEGELENKKKKKRHKNRHKKKERKLEEYLSFSDIDYLMRHNKGIDETKCRGRW